MHVPRLMTWTAAALCAWLPVVHAASCSDDIDRMQARIDARVEAIAAAGPFVPAGVNAGMGVQPTPFGMATVEARMGEVSVNKVDAVRNAMAQARAANAAGKYHACENALADVRSIMRK
jgi:hypothetical protein